MLYLPHRQKALCVFKKNAFFGSSRVFDFVYFKFLIPSPKSSFVREHRAASLFFYFSQQYFVTCILQELVPYIFSCRKYSGFCE